MALATALWFVSTATASEGTITKAEVDSSVPVLEEIVKAAMAQSGVPGVAVAVVYNDEVVFQNGYGVRNRERAEPIDPETVFQIASMSKPLSSTVVSGAVGAGFLDWDDAIAQYAPQFKLSDPWVTAHVSFADLFAHRSGLPGGVAGNDLESIGYDRDTILQRLAFVPLDPFRITYSYSNFGMTLGGEAAAIAADMTWEELSRKMLFEPAGMVSSSMRHSDFVARENRADPHTLMGGEWVSLFKRQPDAQAPAGGASSNVVDLAQWMRLQLNGGRLDGQQIIDEDALNQTHTPQILKRPPSPTIADPASFYGLGWNIETDATGALRWNHSGAFSTGAATTVVLVPAEKIGIVVLTNAAPVGVPESIIDAYLEYLQNGEITTDWVALWTQRFSGIYGTPQDWTNPPANPAPMQPLENYVGTYANDYVGEVRVIEQGKGLAIVQGPVGHTFPLQHWKGDTFIYQHDPEIDEHRETVIFDLDEYGNAVSVTLSALDGASLGTLIRI